MLCKICDFKAPTYYMNQGALTPASLFYGGKTSMKESLTNLCESFVANIELIYRQKGFKIVSTKIMPMCSYMYITSGKAVEPERLLECLKLLESRGGGALSGMRDAFQAPHACSLAVSSYPAVTITRCKDRKEQGAFQRFGSETQDEHRLS